MVASTRRQPKLRLLISRDAFAGLHAPNNRTLHFIAPTPGARRCGLVSKSSRSPGYCFFRGEGLSSLPSPNRRSRYSARAAAVLAVAATVNVLDLAGYFLGTLFPPRVTYFLSFLFTKIGTRNAFVPPDAQAYFRGAWLIPSNEF